MAHRLFRESLQSRLLGLLSAGALVALTLGGCADTKVAGGDGPPCKNSDDCDAGWICTAANECAQLCLIDRECPSDHSCTDGVCAPVTDPTCHTSAECVTPLSCRDASTGSCEGGRCVYGLAVAGTTCTRLCIDGTATCNAGGECTGTLKECTAPPADHCEESDSVCVTYAQVGSCVEETGGCDYAETRTPTTNCAQTCVDACEGITCTETSGGCKSNGHCEATPAPAHCAYNIAGDLTSCYPASDPTTQSGYCNAGVCDDCLGSAIATEDCDRCKGQRARECQNGHWSAWSPCSNASYPGVCDLGETSSEACTGCSANVFHCEADCTWDTGTGCTSECVYGTTADESRSCCTTGTQSRSCQNTCTWGNWGACSVSGSCPPGSTSSQTCCIGGTQTRTCGTECTWGGYGACSQGQCPPGGHQTIAGACGNCGTKQQTCTAGCEWPAATDFACINEGECAATTTRKVNYGCTGDSLSQTWSNEICSNTCAWVADSPTTGTLSCGAYKCSGAACLSTCTGNSNCSGANVCRGGGCAGLGNVGDVCDTADGNADCGAAAPYCVGGICRVCSPGATQDNGTCGGCGTSRKTCTAGGEWPTTWSCVGTGTCNDNEACTTDTCSANGDCVFTARTGVDCNDNDLCTHTDKCTAAGHCAGVGFTCTDAPGTCGANRACNGTDCTVTYPGGETPCDTDLCIYGEVCNSAGACSGGTAVTCTGDECNTSTCNNTATCVVAPKPDFTTACTDNGCLTSAGYCYQGGCEGGTEMTCPESPDGDNCHYNHRCSGLYGYPQCVYDTTTTAAQCTARRIAPIGGDPYAEGWNNPCMWDRCNPANGTCQKMYYPQGPSGYTCAPETNCNAATKCSYAGYCDYGGGAKCYDGNSCTTDSCDPGTGACTYTPFSGTDPGCNDYNSCTYDYCDQGTCSSSFTGGSGCCDLCDRTECLDQSCGYSGGTCLFMGCCWTGYSCTGG